MTQIDWSKAPAGATHYDARGNCCSVGFMKPGLRTGEWEYFGIGGHWILYGLLHREIMDAMVERPKAQDWTGEGLPPVGTVCEWHGPNSDGPSGWVYTESKVVAYTDDGLFVCMQAPSCWPVVQRIDNCEFRPIRTPEQLAAEEREKAANELADEIAGWSGRENPTDRQSQLAMYLYDQCYRKVEVKP